MNDILLAKHFRCPQGLIGKEMGNLMSKVNSYINKCTIDILKLTDNNSVLEIGFGNGTYVTSILGKANNVKYFGLEKSDIMIEEAKRRHYEEIEKGNVELKIVENEVITFDDFSFDAVIAVNLIYFIDNVQLFLKEVNRVLKNEGTLYLSFRAKDTMGVNKISNHGFKLFSTEELVELLTNIGFVEIQTKNVSESNNRDFVMLSAKKLIS